ncbi:MAG TPA: hypothetical protein VKA94_10925 [Hyphomicrobiales bacterium]|nr:hypothetical protein [Hyphomicrobiales bacterium]
MISYHPAKAAFLAAAFACAPIIAQAEPHETLPNGVSVISASPESAFSGGEDFILSAAALEMIRPPASDPYDMAIDNNMDVIGQFLHQRATRPTSDLSGQAIAWIDWGRDAIVSSAQYTGGWIAARSSDVALASRNAYGWLSTRTSFMANAAYDATDWVSQKSQNLGASAQETTYWIATNSKAAATAAVGTLTSAIDGISIMGNWSTGFVDEIKKRLIEDKTSEFAKLISKSGFSLKSVVVGVGLIPELDVEFRHERDLTPEELAAFEKQVDDYAEKVFGPIGYLETVLLRNLARAGELSNDLRIGELHMDLFPFPGLVFHFDPFEFEMKHDEMIENANAKTKVDAWRIRALEQRISKLEAEVAAARSAAVQ